MIIYFQGFIDVSKFEKEARTYGLEPNKVVFLFPGNSLHHGSSNNLFSIKSGGGLAVPAKQFGIRGYPVLSLPTTSMESWSTTPKQQQVVETAIADLYRALGAGYSFMLPIRAHDDTSYFDEGLSYSGGLTEPSFWGQNALIGNKPLANHYTKALNEFHNFIALSNVEKLKKAQADTTNVFYAAYLHGHAMQDHDPWLTLAPVTPIIEVAKPREKVGGTVPVIQESIVKPFDFSAFKKRLPVPDSYRELYRSGHGDFVKSARAILDDYTKGDSMIRRFFSGHWNRHHVQEIAALVRKIDNGSLADGKSIVAALNKIHLVNDEGSLARRLRFLTLKHDNLQNKDDLLAPPQTPMP